MAEVRIVDLGLADEATVHEVAELLVEGFREQYPDAWPTLDSALKEVRESTGPGRVSRVALAAAGGILGWVGAISRYRGHVWEIHPLVVRPDRRREGIGRALVVDVERLAGERGVLTLWVGSDDESGLTSLAGMDLYPDVLGHAAGLRSLRGHPCLFYRRLGFVVAGVLPDANGPGKPDIFLAKRVGAGVRWTKE